MQDEAAVTVFLFTDIEGSTRLWEQSPDRMRDALARHDEISTATVSAHHGRIVKTTGDGIHAAFRDPLDAIEAALALQIALADPEATAGIALRVRCGMHAGVEARRDNDFYGIAVNRAARIMSAAHGGQVLLSQAVATLVRDRLPDGVSLRELGAVRLRDLSVPENVYQLMHRVLRQSFPALRSLEATPNNLPQQLTSFIGREHELAEVRRRLRDARLLTIVGIGGLGKSRLSLQVASEALDDYPDGVWFVELAALTDARLVPQAVASVLGVREEVGRPVLETLARFVHDRRLLLVLDNCEHMTQASAELARRLLEAGPQVSVLATSRERLGLGGENTYPLAPFAVPLPRQRLGPEALAQFGSVRLFAERAAAADPDFSISDENAGGVAEICHRLDGIPLALELAAARVRALSVQKIADRLTDRFKLLQGGDRTALPRQQTLRALIDWSYDLLAPEERVLFARLSVFAGGFTLEAAEKVGAGDAIAEADVLDLLTRLVDKSLVSLEAGRDRYRMLETVRQYAQEQLEAAGDAKATRNRHLHFYVALAESASAHWIGPSQRDWLRRIDAEIENVAAADAWCDHAEDGGPLGLRLVRAIRFYCVNRGLLALGYEATLKALGRPGAQTRNVARSQTLSALGVYATSMGREREALGYLNESLAIARELGDHARVAITLQPLGRTYLALGMIDDARAHLTEALTLAENGGNRRETLAALSNMVQLHRVEGDLGSALTLSERCLEIARGLTDPDSLFIGLINHAMILILTGAAPAQAREIAKEATAVFESGSRLHGQSLLEVTAGLAAAERDWGAAARFYGVAQRESEYSGLKRDPADEAFLAAQMKPVRAELGDAFESAVDGGRAVAFAHALAEAREWLQRGQGINNR
ncbi:MAG TPA: tetratricopeptide repeat protein [Casimicrobiaceae bacterium]|nr:tetratricopeptide repeat protein [Casimicrobiaceae bacterium]